MHGAMTSLVPVKVPDAQQGQGGSNHHERDEEEACRASQHLGQMVMVGPTT